MLKRSIFALILVFLSVAGIVRAEVAVPTVPEGERIYPDFQVWVDGKEAPVWECRVSAIPFNRVWPGYQRDIAQTELAGFATWETNEPTTKIVVKTTRSADVLDDVVVRPLSLNIQPKIDRETKTLEFEVPGTTPTVVELAGYHHCLHLLPFPKYERPKDLNASNLRYFGPGVHQVGVIEVKSGDEIFIDSGAVVYGGVRGTNVENVKISGPGILDAAPYARGEIGGLFRFTNCKNITIDGVVQRDTDVWATTLLKCEDIEIRNTKLVGFWRYNADGIDICNCERVLVENSFLRTFDDALVVKGLLPGDAPENQKSNKDVLCRKCVVWCDWGRALELGAETCAPEYDNIRFEDIDIIRSTHIAMDIQHGDRAKIRNVVFENIRAEFDAKCDTPVYQNSDDHVYDPNADPNYCPQLAVIIISSTFYSRDKINGSVDGVLFKDIQVYSDRMPASSFTGLNEGSNVKNVVFENLRLGEKKIESAQEAKLHKNAFVENVNFK